MIKNSGWYCVCYLNCWAARQLSGLAQSEAKKFAAEESSHDKPSLFGVTDGKAVGTYLEHKF